MKDINGTVLVDLRPTEKKIFKGIHKDARWGIKKAEKEGLVIEEIKNEEEWKKIYEIYKKVLKEGGGAILPLEKIKKTIHVLLLCKKGEEIIGGASIWFSDFYDKNIPRLYFISSSREYWSLQPNNLLYWACIKWSKSKGYKFFDLGGFQINPQGHLKGINEFKKKWGEVVYHYNEYPFIRAIGRKLIRKFGFIRSLWDLLKRRKVN